MALEQAAVAGNIVAALRNREELPEEGPMAEARREVRAEGNKVARNLSLGWDWGKWTCDL